MSNSEDFEKRLQSERDFHDAKYSGEDLYPLHYAANPTAHIYAEMLTSLGDLTGKRVVEYGCGEGWCTIDLCKAGANVDGFDISEEAVHSTTRVLSEAGFAEDVARMRVGAAEQLPYEADKFDVAFGFAILHHLDLEKAIPELHRILRPGGIGIFAEPLQGNPLLRLYRKMTPQFRTPDEKPFLLSSLEETFVGFSTISNREFYLSGQLALAILYVPLLRKLYPQMHKMLWGMDRKILETFPRFGSWAWYSIITVRK